MHFQKFYRVLVGTAPDRGVGHSHTFAVLTVVGSISVAGYILIINPTAWSLLHFMSEF